MPKLDLDEIPQTSATTYPSEYAGAVRGRYYRRLAEAGGLTDFGVSHVVLKPGAQSAQRHWHEGEDEMVVMLTGKAVLVDDYGRTPMCAGDVAAFPKDDGNGHCLVNESDVDCCFVAIGGVGESDCHYSDVDLHWSAKQDRYVRKDGSAFKGQG